MNEIDKPLPELTSMLRTTEQRINNDKAVIIVQSTKTNNGKGKEIAEKTKRQEG